MKLIPDQYPRWAPLGLLLALLPTIALAHAQIGAADGLVTGFMHPVLGPDHVIAMVAVGIWGAQLGGPAIWLLPITFPLVMAVGGMLGAVGVPVPSVEIGIAASAIVLGAMVAAAARPPLGLALAIVCMFAIFHGHAHGTELPEAVNPLAYGVGFVTATGLLHLTGILLGMLIAWPLGERAVRLGGGLIVLGGGWFLMANTGALA